jgi:hypothetical protein
MWGLSYMTKILVYDIMTMGLVYPLSEHVDIFPVRLVSTFPLSILRLPYSNHLSCIVVFILAGGIKDKGWILFLLSIKIHYIFISDMERSTIVTHSLYYDYPF